MLSIRVIPVLLLSGKGLVKTVQFKNPVYVGDPLNAVKVFNDKEVDELIFLDIKATKNNTPPDYHLIESIASECFMPVCYGGGITSVEQVRRILNMGIEKISINNEVLTNRDLIGEAAAIFGSQSIVASIDVKRKITGSRRVYSYISGKTTSYEPVETAVNIEKYGAGELLVTSVDRDGTMNGYDIELLKEIVTKINIPVIACGGAGNLLHFKEARESAGVSAVAAGSMFVFHGKHRAVLLNYPEYGELRKYLM